MRLLLRLLPTNHRKSIILDSSMLLIARVSGPIHLKFCISRDGSTIAFLRRGSATDDVMLIPAIGGPERKVGEVAQNRSGLYGLAWKKDNKNLIVSDAPATGEEPSLFELSTVTGKKRPILMESSGKGGDFFPSVSPNGEKIAFVRSPDGIDAQRSRSAKPRSTRNGRR